MGRFMLGSMELFGQSKIKYMDKFFIREPIFLNDGLFFSS